MDFLSNLEAVFSIWLFLFNSSYRERIKSDWNSKNYIVRASIVFEFVVSLLFNLAIVVIIIFIAGDGIGSK